MNRILGIAFLVAGIVLLAYGINAAQSVSSDVSRLFSGAPTNKSLGLLIGGVVCLALGLGSWRGIRHE
jgi:hypothetical protein